MCVSNDVSVLPFDCLQLLRPVLSTYICFTGVCLLNVYTTYTETHFSSHSHPTTKYYFAIAFNIFLFNLCSFFPLSLCCCIHFVSIWMAVFAFMRTFLFVSFIQLHLHRFRNVASCSMLVLPIYLPVKCEYKSFWLLPYARNSSHTHTHTQHTLRYTDYVPSESGNLRESNETPPLH